MKARKQTCPKNVIAAIHRVIKAKGLPFFSAKLRGRYNVFYGHSGPAQQGYHATKIGCSRSVSIHWSDTNKYAAREIQWQKERELRAILEAEGFVFDSPDRHWIECTGYDFND